MSLESYLKTVEEQRKREKEYNISETDSYSKKSYSKNPKVPIETCAPQISSSNNMYKSKGVAYLLWLLSIFGWLGFHRFYLGKWGTGILWILTVGLLGVGAFIDLFTLGGKVELYNVRVENDQFRRDMRENLLITNSTIAATVSAIAANAARK